MARAYATATQKLLIVLEAETSQVKAVACMDGVQPSQISRWAKNQAALEATVTKTPWAKTLNAGQPRQQVELEEELAS
ncbi:unnamed protein product [Phytophthora fragariaefolia]|uniref:Unnamed protein product n=1 Tax=Phytophthora fragariaefolia TaxID=1490495 RepID=A0A9W6Y7Y3_9STRA|nr:unnamed protein product [Phytophthora fragariaefolia]